MSVSAYLFEAKGIQRYLFMSGELRDVVGASDLITKLASSDGEDLIGGVLSKLKFKLAGSSNGEVGSVSFSRRAGGAFCLHGHHDDLVKVRAVFRLAVMSALPGLEISDAIGEGDSELASQSVAVQLSGGARSNVAASILPLGRPVMEVVRTTALPRISEKEYRKDTVLLDQIQLPLRRHGDALQKKMGTAIKSKKSGIPTSFIIDGVARRFHGQSDGENQPFAYPRKLSDTDDDNAENPLFPWIETDYRMALVHADISGLGEAFQNSGSTDAQGKLKFAKNIEDAINVAVQGANKSVLAKAARSLDDETGMQLVPARPLVVGGDDLTVLVRADLALEFTAALLINIEIATKDIVGGLSACAGVAIGNRNTPFLNLYELAETLCKFAKKTAKSITKADKTPYPSMLAFHHQTQTAFEDYQRDVHPCLELEGDETRLMSANPYEVCQPGSAKKTCQPTYEQLKSLALAVRDNLGAKSALRKIEGYLVDRNEAAAQSIWYRLISRPAQVPGQKEYHDHFETEVKQISAGYKDKVPFGENGQTPLFDALAVIDFGRLDATTELSGETGTSHNAELKEMITV
jgi:hypothetical protein